MQKKWKNVQKNQENCFSEFGVPKLVGLSEQYEYSYIRALSIIQLKIHRVK